MIGLVNPKLRNKTWRVALGAALVASLCSGNEGFAKREETGDSGVEKELRFKQGEAGNEIKALKTELLVIKSEKRALDQLLKLEQKHRGTRMEPEIVLRLAEIYMRRARSERFFEIHRNSQQVLTFAPQLVKEASESKEIRKAIAHYARIQEKFPRYHAMDLVYFNSAYAWQQLNDDRQAENLFRKLIDNHPHSPLVPDSHLAVGEINFKARRYNVALESFKAIRAFPRARVYPYGLYKAAWTYYNLQDAAAGMGQLEEVVAFGRQVAANGWDSKLDLRKEALGDMTLFFGDVKKADQAVDYFIEQGQEIDASPYIMRLVEIYKRHARYGDVETILKGLLQKLPKSEAVASAHEELIWNYERTKKQAEAVAQLQAFDRYCESVTKLAVAPAEPAAKSEGETQDCRAKIAETSKKLATKWHAIWKKFGETKEGGEIASSSEKAYRIYIKSAKPKEADLPTVRYAFAELMFARKFYREASDLYAAIQKDQMAGATVDPKVALGAAYAAVVSLERAVGDKWNDRDEERFVELSDTYVRVHPKGPYVTEVRFKRAFIAYEKEKYEIAAPIFKQIGWAPVEGKSGERVVKSQDLYLDILNVRKDYKGIKEASRDLLKAGVEASRTSHIEKIYREAYFAEIQQQEEKGETTVAIESYKRFAKEQSASDLAPKAWWNASQLQFKSGDAVGGAETCHQLHKLFPQSPNVKDCLMKAAHTYEAIGRLDLASGVVLDLAQVESEKAAHWREVAADFFALSGAKDKAYAMYLKLAEALKADAKALYLALLEKAGAVAHDMDDKKAMAQIDGIYTAKGIEPQASRMVVEQAEKTFESGDLLKAFNISKKIIARDDLPKDLLARARFIQARVLEDEYRKQSVKAKVERIGTVLAIKTEKLEKAQKAFQSVIRYGDAVVSVRALRRLAHCYIDYAKTIRDISLPDTLTAAEQAEFRAETEKLTIPMEEKGIEAMAQALETAKKGRLRNGEIAEIQIEIDRLNLKPVEGGIMTVSAPQVYLPQFRSPSSQEVQP